MAALTLDAAYRALKRGELAPVYYLTGDADLLKDELAMDIVRAAVDEAARDFNVDVRSAGDLDGESLHALVETPPMLAERRAVVIRGLEQWRANAAVWKVLVRYLEQPSPSTVLVLTHGAGEKLQPQVAAGARHVSIDTLSPDLLRRWTSARAQKAGIQIDPDALEHLVVIVGNDLASLAMEIDKLAAAAPPGAPVTLALVSELAGVRRGETQSDWVEAVLRRDAVAAVGLLDVVLPQPGVNGVRLASALGTALVGTRLARALADAGKRPGEISNHLFNYMRQMRIQGVGLWSDEAKRWTSAARDWSGDELDEALAVVRDTDRALKSSTASDERGVLAGMALTLVSRSATRKGAAA